MEASSHLPGHLPVSPFEPPATAALFFSPVRFSILSSASRLDHARPHSRGQSHALCTTQRALPLLANARSPRRAARRVLNATPRLGVMLGECCEGLVDLTFVSRAYDKQLQAESTRRILRLSDFCRGLLGPRVPREC